MRTELKTAPAGYPVTLDEIKEAGFINTTQDDAYITTMIPMVTAWVENYTGRKLIDQEWYVYYDITEYEKYMNLSTFNVTAINEVVYYDEDGNATTVDPSEYDLVGDQLVWNDSHFPTYTSYMRTYNTIRVDVSVGYGADNTEMPPELSQALKIYAIHQRNWSINVQQSGTISGDFKKVPDGLDALLRPYTKRIQWL